VTIRERCAHWIERAEVVRGAIVIVEPRVEGCDIGDFEIRKMRNPWGGFWSVAAKSQPISCKKRT